jgi:hypothetical protein
MKANTAMGLAFGAISLWLLLTGESRNLWGHLARLLALLIVFAAESVIRGLVTPWFELSQMVNDGTS